MKRRIAVLIKFKFSYITFDQATSEQDFTKAKKLMGIFSKFKSGFKQEIANVLQDAVGKVVGRGRLEESDLLDLEEAFYQSDFGVETTEEIIEEFVKPSS